MVEIIVRANRITLKGSSEETAPLIEPLEKSGFVVERQFRGISIYTQELNNKEMSIVTTWLIHNAINKPDVPFPRNLSDKGDAILVVGDLNG